MDDIFNAFILLSNFVIVPGMAYGSQLAIGRNVFQRIDLEAAGISFQVVKDPRLKHEKAAVDPAFARNRLLRKPAHHVPFHHQSAKARRWTHRGDGRDSTMGPMER